jgi:hypothetical protein
VDRVATEACDNGASEYITDDNEERNEQGDEQLEVCYPEAGWGRPTIFFPAAVVGGGEGHRVGKIAAIVAAHAMRCVSAAYMAGRKLGATPRA